MKTLMDTFGLNRSVAFSAVAVSSLVMCVAVFWFLYSAPPTTITITSGPPGSLFHTNALRYAAILARHGVRLQVLPSRGSQENLQRLLDAKAKVDIGFVQGGMTNGLGPDKLVALGSVYYQPLLVFYRAAAPVQLLSEFAGQRLAIGPVGSGARSLALTLLASNGLATNGLAADGKTTLLAAPADEATAGLLAGQVDAVFLMGDSASVDVMRKLMRNPEIQLLDFVQADAYSRRIDYLNKLTIPRGCMDFGRNIPAQDVHLLAPAIELVARPHLHPALSDILLEAATEVHGNASIFRRRGEFPAPLERDFHLSADATRYYKSGKSFLYRTLPFWVASLVNRVIVVFVPMLMILIPGLRLIPAVYKWRLRLRIYRWYRALLVLEGNLATPTAGVSRDEMLRRLDEIERAVDQLKMPASFADQFYALRGHISWVRARLREGSLPR